MTARRAVVSEPANVTRARGLLDRHGEDDPYVRRRFLRSVRDLDRLPLYDAGRQLDALEAELEMIARVVASAPDGPF